MSPSLQIEMGTLVCHAGPACDINVSGKQASQEPLSSHRKPSSMGSYHPLCLQRVRHRSRLLLLHPGQTMHAWQPV